jgi:hypothetical protein
MPPNYHAPLICALGLSCLVSACSATPKMTDTEAAAIKTRLLACEWYAAKQYDDGRYKTFDELVHRVMGECAVELRDARLALSLSSTDSRVDADEFKDAVQTIENARKSRSGR